MKTVVSVTLSVLALSFLSGCATYVTIPSGHSQTPEVPGSDFSASFGAMFSLNRRVVYAIPDSVKGNTSVTVKSGNDFLNRYSSFWDLLSYNYLPIQFSVDFAKRFSVFVNGNQSGLQWQFLGEPSKVAKKGNVAASLVAASMFNNYQGGTNVALGMNSDTLNGSVVASSEVYSVVVGTRFSDDWGLGLNVYAQPVHAWGNGYINGTGPKTDIGLSSVDIGIAPQIYAGGKDFQFLIQPAFVQIMEPVRNSVSTITIWTFRGSVSF